MRDVAGQLVAAGPRAVDALVERAEKAEAQLQEAELRYAREFATRVDFQERAEKAEQRVGELERSMLTHFNEEHLAGDGPEIDRWKRVNTQLKADLDAALNWIEHDEDESIPPAGLWQRVKALLEKRRVERG